MEANKSKSPFAVSIQDGGLECEVVVRAGYDPETTGETLCISALRDHAIEITPAVLKRVGDLITLQVSNTGGSSSLIVAVGEQPVHGKDGQLTFQPKFDPDQKLEEASDCIDSAESVMGDSQSGDGVDHYDRSAFTLVDAGEQIGFLHAPIAGVDGRGVKGETIAAKQGKTVILNVDDSVRVREDGKIESAVSGVVQIDGRKIRVLQKLDIQGSVDFSTGHIKFPGDVFVAMSVKDGFQIQAERDVTIGGLVEAAKVSAGRDLQLLGGVACRQKGTVLAGRDITARYINECNLKAGRNLVVEKEVIHANIAVGGNMDSPNCTLIGGSAFVTGECNIAEIGSERSVPTRLILGKEREADQLTGQAGTLLEAIGLRLKKSQEQHEHYECNAGKLTPTQAELMTELQFEIGTYSKLQDTLSGAVEELSEAVHTVSSVRLKVQKQIWQGVTIVFEDCEATIENAIKGPLLITRNESGIPILRDLTSDSTVELNTVADVRSRNEDQGADEAIAA